MEYWSVGLKQRNGPNLKPKFEEGQSDKIANHGWKPLPQTN
jgi:hypothetical protein